MVLHPSLLVKTKILNYKCNKLWLFKRMYVEITPSVCYKLSPSNRKDQALITKWYSVSLPSDMYELASCAIVERL